MKRLLLAILPLLFCFAYAQQQTFTNPLLPSGADPYSFYKNGFYYYTHTMGDSLVVWKTKNLAELKDAEHKTIFIPPKAAMYSRNLWAPEVHFIRGKWYAYFAADDGKNQNHRLYVLQNDSPDPMKGEWIFKGKVGDSTNRWAIDGDVFEYKNQLYMLWAGWKGGTNGQQDIYIAKMKDPLTIDSKRICISTPTSDWEKYGDLNDKELPHVNVNEGPQALQHNNKLFVIFSASGCWTDYYTLGMLTFTGKNNLLDSASWKKSPQPIFKGSAANSVFAPGHNSFFKSPNGKEDWILY
ncbi:MAG: glycosyl hydrolase family 43, partial [Sphingobacteriaceae bacterium]